MTSPMTEPTQAQPGELPPLPVRFSYFLDSVSDDIAPDIEIDVYSKEQMHARYRLGYDAGACAALASQATPGEPEEMKRLIEQVLEADSDRYIMGDDWHYNARTHLSNYPGVKT